MSPAEFIELISATRDGIGGHINNFITVLFAYLVMTYFVADKLSKFQMWGLTLIYSAYEFLPARAALQEIQMLSALLSQFHEQHPAEAGLYIPFGQTNPIPFMVIAATSWGLSVAFMVQRGLMRDGDGAD